MLKINEKNENKIIKAFHDAKINDTVNWVHENGSVFMTGGLLCKLDSRGDHFVAIKKKWVKV